MEWNLLDRPAGATALTAGHGGHLIADSAAQIQLYRSARLPVEVAAGVLSPGLGIAMAAGGPWFAVGVAPDVYVYQRNGRQFSEVGHLAGAEDGFGQSLAIWGSRLAVGSPKKDLVRVYDLSKGSVSLVGKFTHRTRGRFGLHMAANEHLLVVGDSDRSSPVLVYSMDSDGVVPDPEMLGVPNLARHFGGEKLAVSGNNVVIGSDRTVHVFGRIAKTHAFRELQSLVPPGERGERVRSVAADDVQIVCGSTLGRVWSANRLGDGFDAFVDVGTFGESVEALSVDSASLVVGLAENAGVYTTMKVGSGPRNQDRGFSLPELEHSMQLALVEAQHLDEAHIGLFEASIEVMLTEVANPSAPNASRDNVRYQFAESADLIDLTCAYQFSADDGRLTRRARTQEERTS